MPKTSGYRKFGGLFESEKASPLVSGRFDSGVRVSDADSHTKCLPSQWLLGSCENVRSEIHGP